jgi:hypothetical protein
MPARTDFILSHRQQFDRNAALNYFSDEQRDAWLSFALAEYSRFMPRQNVRGTYTVTTGDDFLVLPDDFLYAEESQLVAAIYGEALPYEVNHDLLLLTAPQLAFDYYANQQAAYSLVAYSQPKPMVKEVEGEMKNVVLLSTAATADRTVSIVYSGVHQVTDSPDLNTLTPDGSRRVHLMMKSQALDQAAQQFALGNPNVSKIFAIQAASAMKEALRGLQFAVV